MILLPFNQLRPDVAQRYWLSDGVFEHTILENLILLSVRFMKYSLIALSAILTFPAFAQTPANIETSGVPEIPPEIAASLSPYQDLRSAKFVDWFREGMLVSTRFGDTNQLHYVEKPLGARRQLTFENEPIDDAIVSGLGDGESFLFTMDAGGSKSHQIYHFDFDTGDITRLSDGESSYKEIQFTHDSSGIGYTIVEHNGQDHLQILDFSGGTRILLENKSSVWRIDDFSPTGDRAIVSENSVNSYLYEMDLKSLERRRLLENEHEISIDMAKYDASGENIYFVSALHYEYLSLWSLNLASGSLENIVSDLKWDVSSFRLSPSRDKLVYKVNQEGYSRLFLLELSSGEEQEITPPGLGQISDIRFSRDGLQLGFSYQSPSSNTDVYALKLDDRSLVRWTESELGELRTEDFVRPSLVTYKSFDELEVPTFVFEPKGEGPHPVVIHIQRSNVSQYCTSFSPTLQYFVNELGLAVIAPNVQDSRGYGTQKRTYGFDESGKQFEDTVRDIGALLDWIETKPQFDSSRIAVQATIGGSIGTMLEALAQYSDQLKVGIAEFGVGDWFVSDSREPGLFRDIRQDLLEDWKREMFSGIRHYMETRDPLNYVDRINSPMLIGQGFNSPYSPPLESEKFVAALTESGVPVWFIYANDEGKGFERKENHDFWMQTLVYFLKEHLLSEQLL